MSDEPPKRRMRCSTHGSTPPTFMCRHLAAPDSHDLGTCYDRESDDPWPDLVCNSCSDEPPWTEQEELDRIRVACAYCWEDVFGNNTSEHHAAPESWLHDALHRVQPKQKKWTEAYGVLQAKRYLYRLEETPPWLGFGPSDENLTVLCEPAVIGSWSGRSGTWLWGWANDWWQPELTREFIAVKRAGERLGIERLWRSQVVCDEQAAWELCSAAVDLVSEFEGIYRSPTDSGALFLAVRGTRRVS
jgi:hypothetical protein